MPARESSLTDDPFDAVLRPPPDETPEQSTLRLAQEAEAKRVSEAIDETLRQEKQRYKKRRVVRVLLLGQSESGAHHSRGLLIQAQMLTGKISCRQVNSLETYAPFII